MVATRSGDSSGHREGKAEAWLRLGGNRNWQLLWFGQSVSAVGDMVFYLTALLWIATIIAKGEPWAPAAASGALIASSAPALIIGPIAGVYVDRWDRRRVMLVADAARCVLIASLLALPPLRHVIPVAAQLAILYAVIVACSSFDQFFTPSRLAVLGAIVPADFQPAASGRLSASFALSQVIGPPIAAPLLITLGVQWALIVNAASFAVSFVTIRAIKVPWRADASPAEKESFGREFRAGIRYFARSTVLVALAAGMSAALLGNGAINSLAVFFVQRDLHKPASWLGFVIGAVGIGAVAGAMLTGTVTKRIPAKQLFWIALTGDGVFLLGFARSTGIGIALGFALLLGFFIGMVNSVMGPIILGVTEQRFIGRVSAVLNPLLELASMIGMLVAGIVASTVLAGFHVRIAGQNVGPYDTVFMAGAILFLLGGLFAAVAMRERR
jgi:MFS family permease